MMKRLAYILAGLLLMTACAGESFEPENNPGGIVDGMIRVDFTVTGLPFQPDTKTFSISPDVRSMKVVVFDQYGVYIAQCDAELSDISTVNNVTTGKYSTNLPVSDEEGAKRIIHFLVNYNGEIEYGTELEVISKLIVKDNIDCYWQRIEVTDLTALEQDGKMVLKHQSQLQGIELIRNFCAYTVSTTPETSNLEILSAAIYNVPDRGTVAPYSSDNSSFVGGSGFVTDYQDYDNPGLLIDAGYKASVPINYELTDYSSDDVLTGVDSEKHITLFSYERETPINDPPFILVSGKWGADAAARDSAPVTYYKINLRDINDEYFPLLRNFRYKILIKEVKRAGSTNVEEALQSIGSGEVSTDIRYSGLTDISNGEARMMVTTTEVVLVSDAPYRELLYKFFPDKSKVDEASNDDVTISLGEPGATGSVFESLSSIVMGSDNTDGWRSITCYPKAPGEAVRTQSVILTGRYMVDAKEYTISRTINFTLRQKPALTAQCLDATTKQPTTVVPGVKESPFILRIGIPNGLPSSIFPIDLVIEASEGTITPNTAVIGNTLPVSNGKSRFGTGKPAFTYTKSVQYHDYNAVDASGDGYKYFDAYFKTNIAASSTDIIVENHYFDSAVTYFTNGEAKRYKFVPTNLTQTSSTTAELSFHMSTVTPVTINLGTTAAPGANATGLVATGTPGVYTYTPTSTGLQHIGLAIDENAGYRIVLSASNYDSATIKKIRIKNTGFTFTGSDRTDNSMAVIPGFTTSITLPASSIEGFSDSATVTFTINGQNVPANLVAGSYTCNYALPSSQAAGSISVAVSITEDGDSGNCELGNISVWKQKITMGNTAITPASSITSYNKWNNRNNDASWTTQGSKKVLLNAGVVFKHKNSNVYLRRNNTSVAVGTTIDDTYLFITNGSNSLMASNGSYMRNTGGNNLTNFTLSDTTSSSGISVNYTQNNGWRIQRSSNNRALGYRYGQLTVINSADDSNTFWTAYPVTVEYVAP